MAVAHEEVKLHSSDGTSLVAQRWGPTDGTMKAEVLVIHGYMEHAERYRELGHAFAAKGIGTLALDLRGHGHSEGRRGFIREWADYQDDFNAGLEALEADQRFILAHSNGALIALELIGGNGANGIRGVVVTNPYLALAFEPPKIKLWIGKKAGQFFPSLSLPSGVESEQLSRDPAIIEAHKRDPQVFRSANAGWFREVGLAQERVKQLEKFPLPLLYVFSDSDPVASPAANRALADRLQAEDKTIWERQGELHEVLNEVERESLHGDIADWILKHASN